MDYNHDEDLEYFKENQDELVGKYDGKQLVIRKCDVVAAFDTVGEAFDFGCKTYGAGNFSIQHCVPVVSSTTSNTANGTAKANRHVVDISIGNVSFPKISVTAPPLPEDDMVLIGMDLIGLGRFTVQNANVNGVIRKVLTLELP